MTTRQEQNLQRAFPELGAGGFSKVDGTVEFFLRVNALLTADMIVLDLGAGRGEQLLNRDAPFRTDLQNLQGRVAKLVGLDVDEAVRKNTFLDEAHVYAPGAPFPFDDVSFDLIFSDWVLEHVDTPAFFASEVYRVLRPGGWFCARTPNRWGMTGMMTNLLPNRHHTTLLRWLQPKREARDVFATRYQLNTKGRLKRHFKPDLWENYSYYHSPEPAYLQGSSVLLRAGMVYTRLAPSALSTNLHIFLRKKAVPGDVCAAMSQR